MGVVVLAAVLTNLAVLKVLAPAFTLFAFFALLISNRAASRRKAGHIEIMPSGELRLSWRQEVIDPRQTGVAFTRWVTQVVHTPAGVVAVFGDFVVGAPGHDDADVPRDTPYRG